MYYLYISYDLHDARIKRGRWLDCPDGYWCKGVYLTELEARDWAEKNIRQPATVTLI